jgi:hypothetical protein
LAIGGAGCSAHPLPDDISRETSYSIIQKVRCEAKAQVKEEVRALLMHSHSPAVQSLEPEKVLLKLDIVRKNDSAIADIIDKYKASVIGYAFTFTINEKDDNGGSADFRLPFSSSTFTLNLVGKANKDRTSDRKIDVVETFAELADLDCSETSGPSRNLLYPITGSIGMGEIVHSYLNLSETLRLGPETKVPQRIFVDTLKFTTDLQATATPSIELKRFPKSKFSLEKSSGTFFVDRHDFHQVIVTLIFPVLRVAEDQGSVRRSVSPELLRSEAPAVYDETKKLASEELCIQRALSREQQTGIVRYEAPEVYCRKDVQRGYRRDLENLSAPQ